MHSRKLRLRNVTLGLIIAMTGGVSQAAKPNDPLYESSINLGLNILPIYYQWGLPALNLEPAWELIRGHAYISIVDTGIDTDHPDLTDNFRPQFSYDFGSGITDDDDVDERNDDLVGLGHGTHIAGIIAGTSNNNIGTASICWNCSIMIEKITGNSDAEPTDIKARALKWAIDNGAQVINLSSGGTSSAYLGRDGWTCDDVLDHASSYNGTIAEGSSMAASIDYCEALAYAEVMDVVLVAASGNGVRTEINEIHFPASDPRTIAVGAIDITGSATPILANSIAISYDGIDETQGVVDETPSETHTVQFNHGPEMDLVAPGFNVLSTFYEDATWNDAYERGNPYFKTECADYIDITTPYTPTNSSGEHEENNYSGPRPGGDGYGPCSGTSMATPHVTGLVGLLRSINPLLKKDQIKTALINHARVDEDVVPDPNQNVYGHGMPDALASVQDVLGTSNGMQLKNRLTPLFSLVSTDGQDHFNTTSPQMAMAAMYGAMQPQPTSGQVNWHSIGATTLGYKNFPKPGFWWTDKPRAAVYILTTHNDPFNQGRTLLPLYRLSIQREHGSNNLNVDHTYTTDQAGIDAYKADKYKLDGIEGYIFSRTETPPTGTVKLYRKYNPTRGDNAIFPESMLSYMTSQGYTQNSGDGSDWIGYVYPNVDSDWDGVINGFEDILGTDSSDSDSDDDGIKDGIEVNNYPYGDPMDPNS